jgi:hypothetical protein
MRLDYALMDMSFRAVSDGQRRYLRRLDKHALGVVVIFKLVD